MIVFFRSFNLEIRLLELQGDENELVGKLESSKKWIIRGCHRQCTSGGGFEKEFSLRSPRLRVRSLSYGARIQFGRGVLQYAPLLFGRRVLPSHRLSQIYRDCSSAW
jgi:hypothetical protein